MPQAPFKKLAIEIARLRALYMTCIYSYEQTGAAVRLKIRTADLDPQDPILLNPADADSRVANSAHAFLHRTKSQFPRYLRETIFVRLISALEVYVIDIIRDLFLHRRDLFHSDQRFEFSHREILAARTVTTLWTKIINGEIRKIQNQGFKEIVRFFDQRLGIHLGQSPASIKSLQEMHDRRHLLVHRLGRADSQYRHTYDVNIKLLTVDEQYLFSAFDAAFTFAEFVWTEAQGLIEKAVPTHIPADERTETWTVEVVTDIGSALIDPEYQFHVDERFARLSDILAEKNSDGDSCLLTLSGPAALITEYAKRLKSAAKKEHLIVHARQRKGSNWQGKRRSRLPRSDLESIARLLPSQPWPVGIHKEIASNRGISNIQASTAIANILDDPELKALIGRTHVA